MPVSPCVVFLSYSHDSDAHREQVLALSERLRADGIETRLDRYVNGTPAEGWPRWMLNQLDAAAFVLVVCTETYYRRFRGHEAPRVGRGVDWEGALITQELYLSKSTTTKFVPVFLGDVIENWIPEPLRAGTAYPITSAEVYQKLYDFLLGQAGVEPGAVGRAKVRPRSTGAALILDENRPAARKSVAADISRIVKYAPAELIGRDAEMALLSDAWEKALRGETTRPHLLTFVALGGEGKTSLVARWAAQLGHAGWPGCDAVFAWSFYHQGTDEKSADSSDLFLKEALLFFGDPEMARSAQGEFDKGRRLAQLVGQQHALLILDGLEPLQYAPTSPTPNELKDQGVNALLQGLATLNRGLCVITTRYSIPDLRAHWQTTAPEIPLTRLAPAAGAALLRSLGVTGTPPEFAQLVEDVKGHALTLNLLGTYLRAGHAGDIRQRDRIRFEETDAEVQGGHAFRVIDAYAQAFENEGEKGRRALAVLRLLGLFDRPATADCLFTLLHAPAIPALTEAFFTVEKKWLGLQQVRHAIEPRELNPIFTRLEDAKLLTVQRDAAGTLLSLDAHPLVRDYFARYVRTQQPEAWRAAHRRLYEHLCLTTKEKSQPTLEDLQPLYQAVAHGCRAGLHQAACEAVFERRIQRGESYSTSKLGAVGSDLGAVACFFERPWTRLATGMDERAQAWLLTVAGLNLRALGRLNDALEPMRATLEMTTRRGDWKNAAMDASNLGQLRLTLGDVTGAAEDTTHSVELADRSGYWAHRAAMRAIRGGVLHQAGLGAEAENAFHAAEEIQRTSQPGYPLLYSLQGFLYCDWLLAASERAAWQQLLSSRAPQPTSPLAASCQAVTQRAAQTLAWTTGALGVLDEALDHLTLGRAALHQAILGGTPLDASRDELQVAVDGLRRAAAQHRLPHGLLARAWLRGAQGNLTGPESAQADLDEAWTIAGRGPMPLFLVDTLLHRARLFGREKNYPWPNTSARLDLVEARRLIEKHGYGRRRDELADAEAVIA